MKGKESMEELHELTKSELEIMKILWQADHDLLLSEILPLIEEKYNKRWKRQTVSTFLSHLIEKGVADSDRKGRYFYYRAIVTEDSYKLNEINNTVNFWCNGSVKNLISALCDQEKLSLSQSEKIERILDELDN